MNEGEAAMNEGEAATVIFFEAIRTAFKAADPVVDQAAVDEESMDGDGPGNRKVFAGESDNQ